MKNKEKLEQLLRLVDGMRNEPKGEEFRGVDKRDGKYYNYDNRTQMALKVALITGRPLLMVGPPGCGKSSLMPFVARNLHLWQETYTVTESAEASDLLWNVNYIRQLNDAMQVGFDPNAKKKDLKNISQYIEQGVLWRAFKPKKQDENDPAKKLGTVVLIDEIDKADSSFANSLLVAVGSLQFDVPPLKRSATLDSTETSPSANEIDSIIKADEDTFVLIIMTSNQERELPPALKRRCVTLEVKYPTARELVKIAEATWTWMSDEGFKAKVTSLAEGLARDPTDEDGTGISTAEFLDLVQVWKLGQIEGSADEKERWELVTKLVLHSNHR